MQVSLSQLDYRALRALIEVDSEENHYKAWLALSDLLDRMWATPKQKFVRPMIASVLPNGYLRLGSAVLKRFGISKDTIEVDGESHWPHALLIWQEEHPEDDGTPELVLYAQVVDYTDTDGYYIYTRSNQSFVVCASLFYDMGYDPRIKKISFTVEPIEENGVLQMKLIGTVTDRKFRGDA